VLVSFGDKIAFEDTLDLALDQLFGGDSGASAGDTGVPPETGTGGTGTGTGTGTGGTPTPTSNPALQQALQDAQQALTDRAAAYAKNDLVAAAQADARLQDAIQRAVAASAG
jgi:uncharacterized membrane protein (UPF0182 family)